ncbi:hypothetical protein ACMAUO_11825 [Gluconacetobacter sp. Hr-1-5]
MTGGTGIMTGVAAGGAVADTTRAAAVIIPEGMVAVADPAADTETPA